VAGVSGRTIEARKAMLFCTEKFLLFFLVVFLAYWALPWRRARVWLLLGASYYFYASWNASLARLIFLTTVCDYFIARGMDATAVPWRRRMLMLTSIVGNLGVLCYFKYANFFLDSLREVLTAAGASASIPVLSVVLPVGISFYTFEAISYTVDVFRGRIPAERNLDHFLLFILFFPHLVAGPIVRASDFLPQVRRPKVLSWTRFAIGGRLILLGMFKKMVIADRMALLVDPIFANPGSYETAIVWMAAVAYSIQIYCDFSGYSDIALGTARLLGYRLSINFAMPLAAKNISDLWRRWHMSLSSWIRDYIYIPLGGNRGSVARTSFNVLFAMTLCGLWHGANWTFVVWGALNGLCLVIHRAFRATTRDLPEVRTLLHSLPGTVFRIALTFTTFTLAFVIFRSPSFGTAAEVFHRMFIPASGAGSPVAVGPIWLLGAVVFFAHLLGNRPEAWNVWYGLPAPVRGLALAGMLAATLILVPVTTGMFIYFQF
jgi:alginate O-acetyltransferase complex protein AlgI